LIQVTVPDLQEQRMRFILRFLNAFFTLACAGSATVWAQSLDKPFTVIEPEQVQWTEASQGIRFAAISGDPSKPGPYVIRVYFTPGIMSAPHYHPEDRHVTVMQGTWLAGKDDSWDPQSTQALKAGSYMKHPAGAIHYDGGGTEGAIVQIMGMGPSSTTFLFPQVGDFGSPHKLK